MMASSVARALHRSSRRRWAMPNICCAKSSGGGGGTNLPNSSHLLMSTISFDGNIAFDANGISSSESVGSPPSSLKQSSTQSRHIARKLSNTSPYQFAQQIEKWMHTNPQIAPYKAEESLSRLWVDQKDLFHQWEEQQQTSVGVAASSPKIVLTTESVNIVLQAWCYSNQGEIAAERAERLLHWMEALHDTTQPAWSSFLPKPDYQSYATVIDAWSRAAVYESSHPSPSSDETERKSGGRAKNNIVSQATKAGFEGAKRAEEILMHMQRMHEDNEQSEQYNSEIQPDTRAFNLVLKAWAKLHGGTKASAIRAMRILDLMQEIHFQSRDATSWQGLVLSKVQPNLQTYKLVLHAWAASHTVEGPDRAEEILRHMLSLSKAGNIGLEILPDAKCFHIVMKAHAEAIRKGIKGDDGSAAERAHKVTALLDWMELLGVRSATSKIQPTSDSYRIALSAWVWSHHVDAPKEAESILYRMIRASQDTKIVVTGDTASVKSQSDSCTVQPETRDFNTLINCCSFARRVGVDKSEEDKLSLFQRQVAHREIYNIAEGALHALISSPHAQPDSATFSGIIRAAINLLPNTDERDEQIIELFRLAYRTPPAEGSTSTRITSTTSERMQAPPGAGCVDANVLRQLRHALPSTDDYIRVREEFEEYRRQNIGDHQNGGE